MQKGEEREEKKEGGCWKSKDPVVVCHAFPCTYVCMHACTHLRNYACIYMGSHKEMAGVHEEQSARKERQGSPEERRQGKKKKKKETVCEPQPRPHRRDSRLKQLPHGVRRLCVTREKKIQDKEAVVVQ